MHSFIHVDDAAAATVAALKRRPASTTSSTTTPRRRTSGCPAFAAALGAPPPRHVPALPVKLLGAGRSSPGRRALEGHEQRPREGGAGLDTRPWVLADRVPRPVRFLHGARRATEAGQRMPAVLDVLRPRDQALELHRLQLPRALPVRRPADRAPLHGLPAQGVRHRDRHRAVRAGGEVAAPASASSSSPARRASAARSRSSAPSRTSTTASTGASSTGPRRRRALCGPSTCATGSDGPPQDLSRERSPSWGAPMKDPRLRCRRPGHGLGGRTF